MRDDIPGSIRFDLRLEPVTPLGGRSTAVFTTGPAPLGHLENVVFSSRNLADRAALRRDLELADAEVFVVELKAAAIDVVAEAAAARGVEVVLARNEVVAPDLDEAVLELANRVTSRENALT
jgi:cyclic 2,3-diphosphoglycerate synthetase